MTNKIKTILISFLIILCSCDQQSSKVKYLQSEENKIKNYPFSEAVKVGDMLYLSGQIGTSIENDGGLVPGGIRQETRQTMLDIKEWAIMSEEYIKFFPNHKPARSAFAGTGLALGARVEIECIAKVD